MNQTSLLDLLPEDTRANRRPLPGGERARAMTAGSGRKCSGLSGLHGPLGSCVKMLLDTSLWASMEFFLTWRIQVTPQGRLLFRLAPSMPRISANEFGFWPTPLARDYRGARSEESLEKRREGAFGLQLNDFVMHMAAWSTPSVCGNYNRKGASANSGDGLATQAQFAVWPTPTAQPDGKSPAAHMEMKRNMKGGTRKAITDLQVMAKAVHHGIEPDASGAPMARCGGLNPDFPCWLMGYPEGWARLEDTGTP